jgi:hypothetical protein
MTDIEFKMLRLFLRNGNLGCITKQLRACGGFKVLDSLLAKHFVYCVEATAFRKRWQISERGKAAYYRDARFTA